MTVSVRLRPFLTRLGISAFLAVVGLVNTAESRSIRVTYTVISGSSWPVWIAESSGIFQKNGLQAQLIYIASASKSIQALLGGDVHFIATAAGPAVMTARLQGADVVMIGATANRPIFFLMVRPDIKTPAALKGKKLGITRFGSSTDFSTRYALKKWGLKLNEDVAVLQMGGVPEVLAGMNAGSIDGGMLSSPTDLVARKQGYKELADMNEIGVVFPQTTITTSRRYFETHKDTVRRFLMAIAEASHIMRTNKRVAMEIFAKYTRTTDPIILDNSYETYVKSIERIPYINPEAVQVALGIIQKDYKRAEIARPAEFIDNSLLQELEKSGFFDKLWGGKF